MIKIPSFRFWCQKVLPLVYDDSLSYYELLNKVVEYLNDIINTVNATTEQMDIVSTALNELEQYVSNYFDNLDVQEEINNKLDEMVEDGTLQTLLENIVYSPSFVFERIFRDYKNTGRFLNTANYGSMPAFAQGGCLTPNGYMIAYINGYALNSYNTVQLVEYTMTGNTIRTANKDVGHCNDIVYHDNKIYLCRDFMLSSGEHVKYDKIDIFDYSTLSYQNSIECPFTPVSCDFVDDTLLAMDDSQNLYTYEDGSWTFKYQMRGYGYQIFRYHDGFIYQLVNSPALIIKRNYTTGEIVRINPIDRSYGLFYVGEPQGISIDTDGNLYMHSSVNAPYNVLQYTFIWKSNINNGWYVNDKAVATEMGAKNYYISLSNTNNNPDGSSSNPFKYPSECCLTAMLTGASSINFVGTENTYEDALYLTGINTYVKGGANSVAFVRLTRSNVVLDHLDTYGAESDVDSNINIGDCGNVYIYAGEFSNEENNIDAYIVNNRSNITYTGCVFNGSILPIKWNSATPIIKNDRNKVLYQIINEDSYWKHLYTLTAGSDDVNDLIEFEDQIPSNLENTNTCSKITLYSRLGDAYYSHVIPIARTDIRTDLLSNDGFDFDTVIVTSSDTYTISHNIKTSGYTLTDIDGATDYQTIGIMFN